MRAQVEVRINLLTEFKCKTLFLSHSLNPPIQILKPLLKLSAHACDKVLNMVNFLLNQVQLPVLVVPSRSEV
jgi:hypothetical protein